MTNETLKRQIVVEAAAQVVSRREQNYHRAIRKAAKYLGVGRGFRGDLPTPRELHAELQRIHSRHEEGRPASLVLVDPLLVEGGGDLPTPTIDRFSVYRAVLMPLAAVRLNRDRHPEGDALYHSLQVYVLARDAVPYDEEFQLAALLHDVGKGIDPADHVDAALTALDGYITDRTAWLIEHHDAAHRHRDRTLGSRARRRLQQAAEFELLELLADCDRRGRMVGMPVPDVDEALDELRDLADDDDEAAWSTEPS